MTDGPESSHAPDSPPLSCSGGSPQATEPPRHCWDLPNPVLSQVGGRGAPVAPLLGPCLWEAQVPGTLHGEAQHGRHWAGGLQPLRGVQAPTLNPLLAQPPQPVGSCLYLVTLRGFASSTGIWHLRWKISLVRSPWKQAEPLRRFTLNGAHPACIRCPVCLEFPPRLLEPLGRPGASLPRKVSGLCPWDGCRQP